MGGIVEYQVVSGTAAQIRLKNPDHSKGMGEQMWRTINVREGGADVVLGGMPIGR